MNLPLPLLSSWDALLRSWAQGAVAAVYFTAQALLLIYSAHRYSVLWRWHRLRARPKATTLEEPSPWPRVTVQLPVYNERRVVERLIDAVSRLEYPADRLEIQVLDDSNDETREAAAAAVARHRARGVPIWHLCRPRRDGYKAGALASGLASAHGDLIAVFDADFVPSPDFLRRIVPRFVDPEVGMVQARWGHLNRDTSALTAAQATMLDSHFLLEHEVRMAGGMFFNFNGTAGVWRRKCIEDSGGWSHETLTEDLDISYRAQLKGWRFLFDASVEAAAELPTDMEAFKSQQRRWAKGSIQTARKLLPRIFASALPWRVKLEALFHLTSNFAYPLLLVLALLLLPVLLAPPSLPLALVWALQGAVLLLGVLPVTAFLAAGRWAAGGSLARSVGDASAAMVLGVGLSVNNARAVLEGLGSRPGAWERTPKSGDRRARFRPYASTRRLSGRTELVLALYFAGLGAFALSAGQYRAVPFMVLLLAGFGYVGWGSLSASLRSARAAA